MVSNRPSIVGSASTRPRHRGSGGVVSGSSGNPESVEEEFRRLVNLAEEVELRLAEGADSEVRAVRTDAPPSIAEGFEDVVAEYYRKLSRSAQ